MNEVFTVKAATYSFLVLDIKSRSIYVVVIERHLELSKKPQPAGLVVVQVMVEVSCRVVE